MLGIFIWTTVNQNATADIKEGSARISFLDVGQGDSALINLPNSKQILIDTGEFPVVTQKIASQMPSFDREIEIVFLTHPDSDHVGGFEAVASGYKIDMVYLNTEKGDTKTFKRIKDKIDKEKIPYRVAYAGEDIYLGESLTKVLWPIENATLSENNLSLILLFKIKESRALFTGDIEIEGQNRLLYSGLKDELKADIYKVPHHGSAGALNENFLKAVGAKLAVVSVGKNSYGHPAKIVLDALLGLGMKVFRTDELGTIDFISTENGWVRR
ncbi:MAG: MBL fold metallo-hydrolase [bacterium]